jgi:hypothetical protein
VLWFFFYHLEAQICFCLACHVHVLCSRVIYCSREYCSLRWILSGCISALCVEDKPLLQDIYCPRGEVVCQWCAGHYNGSFCLDSFWSWPVVSRAEVGYVYPWALARPLYQLLWLDRWRFLILDVNCSYCYPTVYDLLMVISGCVAKGLMFWLQTWHWQLARKYEDGVELLPFLILGPSSCMCFLWNLSRVVTFSVVVWQSV